MNVVEKFLDRLYIKRYKPINDIPIEFRGNVRNDKQHTLSCIKARKKRKTKR